LNAEIAVIDVDEASKTMDSVLRVCRAAERAKLGRRDIMVAIGGGVCSDIVRSAAALYRRGVPHLCIPTTLIAQIDAAIGIKAGLNFDGAKSKIGVFRPPEAVYIDPGLLRTLGRTFLRDGFAEALKLAISLDKSLFALIERSGPSLVASHFNDTDGDGRRIIDRSIALTLAELDLDIYETGSLRRMLDFGHSVSPAIEAVTGFAVSHGQAVMIDMALSSMIAFELGLLDAPDAGRIIAVARSIGLPVDHPVLDRALLGSAIASTIRHRNGALNLVVPTALGAATFVGAQDLSPSLLDAALARLRQAAKPQAERAVVLGSA